MFHVVLVQPEIPPNTGNIIRLCANAGAALHLVRPLGFELDDARLRRAGLDYHEYAQIRVHEDWAACRAAAPAAARWFAMSTRGTGRVFETVFRAGDHLVFGSETRGLPESVLAEFPIEHRLRLPMRAGNRSLNLSNAVAVTVFEAWRQQGFDGSAPPGG
ncbi:MAG: tRNA (cytidine(34)-2'-O)-methyltransferase [Burkholderiaceae bacterium]